MREYLNKNRVHELYHEKKLSMSAISKILNCSQSLIYTFMTENNIPRRHRGSGRHHVKSLKDKKPYGEISRAYWEFLVSEARTTLLPIDITLPYIWNLFIEQEGKCSCSKVPIHLVGHYQKDKARQTAVLERIDLSKGYVIGNVRWVHRDFHMLRKTYNDIQLYDFCSAIINNVQRTADIEKNIKKKVLILGGTGFLGKVLLSTINTSPDSDKYNVTAVGSEQYNLMIKEHVESLYKLKKPDIIINLAAVVGGIEANQRTPGRFFYDNMLINLNVIEEARKISLQKFIQIGTTCSYGKNCPVPFKEEYLFTEYPEPTNAPYGIAKLATLVMLKAYKEQYSLNSIYLIPTNLYGPGDNFNPKTSHVIPAIILKIANAIKNKSDHVTLFGTGKPSRDFIYVHDCAQAICLAMEKYGNLEPVNIGSGIEVTIADIAQRIATIMNFGGKIVWDVLKPDGQPRRCLDTSKAKTEFGFKANTTLDVGLKETIKWFYEGKNNVNAPTSVGN